MAKAAREQLTQALSNHLNIIHETFQVLDQTPASSLEKVSWKDVIQMGENVHKRATTVGMLYTGDTPGVKALEENMSAYFNMMQGLLLLSHGSMIGAGPTLSSCIHKSIKLVVDSSFMLFQEAVSSYGLPNKSSKQSIPPLVGVVWDACSALKKTPSTNVTAIGRAMTQIGATMKDVLREMNELRPAPDDPTTKAPEEEDEDEDEDLGNDLSPDEMKTAQLTITAVSEILGVIKELIRSITRLVRGEDREGSASFVDSLEKLLVACKGVGVQVDELGACLYPPQEVSAIKEALGKILGFCDEIEMELRRIEGYTEDFGRAYTSLKTRLRLLECEVGCEGFQSRMENLVIGD
ncbi:Unknown protein [Striga hermonthica]|uniref:Uncharacterized protein n=1 Tax=Striga hermonthica TaxID=68872 RepID=A0A9N7MWG0_STRHE|nr:Unknown protein [Striga hermonthica]